MAAARYVLLNTGHADHAAAIQTCTAAAVQEWPGNALGRRASNDDTMELVKVPPGFVMGGAVVLAIYDDPPRDLLDGPNWQDDQGAESP